MTEYHVAVRGAPPLLIAAGAAVGLITGSLR